MYKFNNAFLEDVGLSSMPEAQKASFLEYAQDQFETRIGEKMSEGLSDEQLDKVKETSEKVHKSGRSKHDRKLFVQGLPA